MKRKFLLETGKWMTTKTTIKMKKIAEKLNFSEMRIKSTLVLTATAQW